MDYKLIRRRNNSRQAGIECWLVAFYSATGTTPLLSLTNYEDGVVLDGVTYTYYNMSVEEPPNAASDELPSGALIISNVTLEMQQSMAANDYYRGGRCLFLCYNTEEPDASYTNEWKELQIISHETTLRQIKFVLSVPKELTEPIPEDLYNTFSCRHRFRISKRCGYVGQSISDISISAGNPVSITATGHGFATGDYIKIEDADEAGISPSLDGIYVITLSDSDPDNAFTLDTTNGADYTGSYTSGAKAGYAYCEQTLSDCEERNRASSFGGFFGLRMDGIVIGQ